MPTVCVTGAAGFIGYHLARRLLDLGWEVTGIDNLNDYYDVELKHDRLRLLHPFQKFKFHQLDICDHRELQAIYAKEEFNYTVHLAAQVGIRYSLENPRAYSHNNVAGFLNILECCQLSQCKHLVYASSSSVYGLNAKMPSSVRDHVDHPKSLYAATKRANELMAHVYSHLYGLPTTGLRFFTVYGPWGRPDMAPFLFTKALFDGTPIKAFNHGDLRRDFTFIDDVIDAVVPLIEVIPEPTEDAPCQSPDRSSAPYRIYNVGNQRPVELRYLIELIERYTERKAPCLTAPMQPGDVVATYADVSELAETLGFCPRTSIEDGLRNFVSWYCDHYRPRSELKSKVNRPLRR